jgi:adenylate cyclase
LLKKIGLFTGLILFLYVTTHLLNHTLGLISLEAMEDGRDIFLLIWRNPLGTLIIYGSLLIHFALAIWALFRRRNLSMTFSEATQLIFGISLPLLLAMHVMGTRMAHEIAGTTDNYAYVLLVHWKFSNKYIAYQTVALLAAWIHGCIGIHNWLRLRPLSVWAKQSLFAAALLLPTLSLLGYTQGGRSVLVLSRNPEWMKQASTVIHWPNKDALGEITFWVEAVWVVVISGFVLALIAREIRFYIEKSRGSFRITYDDDRTVSAATGTTILDVSRHFSIPHAAVCGGRGRCSTCRVRILEGLDSLSPTSEDELHVLERIGSPPNVRLACQARPTRDIAIARLLSPQASVRDVHTRTGRHSGQEMEIAVLFSDIRSFTKFSEKKLPYDVVFVLNRYFAEMGEAIESAGGRLDKFIGDGVMALFGIDGNIEQACRQALLAARAMTRNLEKLNRSLASEIGEPLRLGIGIHTGTVIVGEMGHGNATHLTAIGDTVNTASRLESMNKEFSSQLVVSGDVAKRAGVNLSEFPGNEIDVRGRADAIHIHIITNLEDLPLEPGQK